MIIPYRIEFIRNITIEPLSYLCVIVSHIVAFPGRPALELSVSQPASIFSAFHKHASYWRDRILNGCVESHNIGTLTVCVSSDTKTFGNMCMHGLQIVLIKNDHSQLKTACQLLSSCAGSRLSRFLLDQNKIISSQPIPQGMIWFMALDWQQYPILPKYCRLHLSAPQSNKTTIRFAPTSCSRRMTNTVFIRCAALCCTITSSRQPKRGNCI